MNISDVSAIITALGGRQALQELVGVGPSAISNYLAKGALPQRAHGPVCEALRARGYRIDPASLSITGDSAVPDLSGTLPGRNGCFLWSVAASPPTRRWKWRGAFRTIMSV